MRAKSTTMAMSEGYGKEEVVVLVRHLPGELSDQEKSDFLVHFGAREVRVMPKYGRLRHTAFACFPNRKAALKAIQRLHQLEVLGSVLSLEFAHPQEACHFPCKLPPCPRLAKKSEETVEEKKPVIEEKPKPKFNVHEDPVFAKHGLDYPKNPTLSYLYPPPSISILTNIANTMAACPRFYVQVLHLMNKMHLPAPFGSTTPTPPLAKEESSSSSESEMESDEDPVRSQPRPPTTAVKRPAGAPKTESRPKRARLDISVPPIPPLAAPLNPQPLPEVFELAPPAPTPRHIALRLPTTVTASSQPQGVSMEQAADSARGFGFIHPESKADDLEETSMEEESFDISDIITASDLRRNRLSDREMQEMSVFRNYQRGEPSCRLYVKNLAKQTQETDLHSIYGRYVDWTEETEKNIFDVRLMKEGRMKGQAFVTLPSEVKAIQALEETNGYILHDKPMVVQFARSAKAST